MTLRTIKFTGPDTLLLQELHRQYKQKGRYKWRYIEFAFNRISKVKRSKNALFAKWSRMSEAKRAARNIWAANYPTISEIIPGGMNSGEDSDYSDDSTTSDDCAISDDDFCSSDEGGSSYMDCSSDDDNEGALVPAKPRIKTKSKQDVRSKLTGCKSRKVPGESSGLKMIKLERHLHHGLIWVEDLTFAIRPAPTHVTGLSLKLVTPSESVASHET